MNPRPSCWLAVAALALVCFGCGRVPGSSYSFTEGLGDRSSAAAPSPPTSGSPRAQRRPQAAHGRGPFAAPWSVIASPSPDVAVDIPEVASPPAPSPSRLNRGGPPAPPAPDVPPPTPVATPSRPRSVAVVPRPHPAFVGAEPGEREAADRGTRLLTGTFKLTQDGDLVNRADDIGQRLAARSPRPNLPWTFEVLDADVLDAVSVGLGRVYITRGLVTLCDDDELAGALSHAVAHGCLRHVTPTDTTLETTREWLRKAADAHERALAAQADPLGAESRQRYEAAMREYDECRKMATQSAAKRQTGPQSWDAEYDTDRCAVRCLREAGMKPDAIVRWLEKLRLQRVVGQTALMYSVSPHPAVDERIKIAKKVLEELNVPR